MPISPLLRRRPPARDRSPGPTHLDLEDGESLPVTIRRNARAKRLILRLSPGAAGVVVTAPPRVSSPVIGEFLERHRGWVEDRVSKAPRTIAISPDVSIPLRGTPLRLVHDPNHRGQSILVETGERRLVVGGSCEHFARRAVDALKRHARADLQAAVDRHADAIGLKPRSLAIKDTTSRWGSCSSDRRLAFSWRIVMAPPEVLDYLAAHEVAHFREMNHGPSFWALCRELCPHMDESRIWLRRHGASLHAVRSL